EPDPIKLSGYNGFQRLVHVLSKVPYKNKKMWGASPTFRSRTIPAQQIKVPDAPESVKRADNRALGQFDPTPTTAELGNGDGKRAGRDSFPHRVHGSANMRAT